MTTTIRTSAPHELLALVPYQLGFQPRDSAVVISLRGGTRVGLVARVDLPDLADRCVGPQVARSLVGHLVDDGAGAVVLVLYTDEDLADPTSGRRAVAHLADALDPYLPEPDCWVVGPSGYRALECDDHGCCPPAGRPLSDLQSTCVGAEMVLLGAQVLGDREDLGRLPTPSAQARRGARRAAQRWAARARPVAGPGELLGWRTAGLRLWRDLVAGSGGAATELGRLSAALEDILVRDAVLVDLVPGYGVVADRVLGGWDGPELGDALAAIVDPRCAVAPSGERIAAAAEVLLQTAAHRPTAAAPALTLLALVSWWQGDGARAGVLVDRVRAERPGYRLADLVSQTLDAGMPPGWARRDRA